MKKLIMLAMVIGLLVGGCATATVTMVSNIKYAATVESKIEILYQEPQKPFTVIALIDTGGCCWTVDGAVDELKKEAAKTGADAVVLLSVKKKTFDLGDNNARATGRAIKWIK